MCMGLTVNLTFTVMGLHWSNSPAQRCVAILLPLIVLVVTKVIASNLALALGMVGALSIVRFRSPVKNPFELVTFFSFIVIGVSAGVHIYYAAVVGTATILTPIFNLWVQRLFPAPLSKQDQHFAERTTATFHLLGVVDRNAVLDAARRYENSLHSLFHKSNETEGEDIEVTFFVEGLQNFTQLSEEFQSCATEVTSSLQQY